MGLRKTHNLQKFKMKSTCTNQKWKLLVQIWTKMVHIWTKGEQNSQDTSQLGFEKNHHLLSNIVNPFYNHAHCSHILVCVTHFLITIRFNEKNHSLKSLSHSSLAHKICKAFFVNVTTMGEI
jgi:hypothetical protein